MVSVVQAAVGADEVIPTAHPTARYSAMREHCPFAIAAPVSTPAPPQPSFAANWYVSGIARVGDADFVSIKARDLSSQFSLFGREPDTKSGVSLVGIEWMEGLGKSVVTIQKGPEIAKLEFNEAVVHGISQNAGTPNTVPNAKGHGPVVVPPPLPATRPLPVPNGYDPSKFPRAGQFPGRPPVGQVGMQTTAKLPYQVPTGVSKPMPPYPRHPFVPATQAVR
jgi:hypothetical protein